MSRRPSDVDPFAGPAPVPFARPVTADRARTDVSAPAASSAAPAPRAATLSGASEAVRQAGAEAASVRKVDQDLEFLIRARYSVLYMLTGEERRAEATVQRVALKRQTKVFVWSVTEGMRMPDETAVDWSPQDYKDPLKALQFVLDRDARAIFIMRDAHPYQKNPEFVRKLRDVAHKLKTTKKTLILMSSVLAVPPEMEKELAVVEFPLPDLAEITEIFERNLRSAKEAYAEHPEKIRLIDDNLKDPKEVERIIEGALGLTADEAENVFAKSLVQKGFFDIKVILSEKERIVKKSGILEFFPTQEKMENIGGLDRLKDWLGKREAAFGRAARDYGLPRPKGILMLGIPGCGKSLTAKAVGAFWQMPLLRLDMGKIFAGLVGGSEENMRRAIAMAEAVSPSILWLDELEKGLSGTGSSNSTDGGTSARVFGSFIAWMQEKTSPVFVIATANDVSQLPPELMRKGRFDEIFFVDLPTLPEREEIFAIHLAKRNRRRDDFETRKLAEISEGMSGAEIEQAVVAAMFDAFYAQTEVTTEHIIKGLEETVPLSRTMKEKIAELRAWCRARARPASSAYEEAPKPANAPRSLDL
jgi:ATP-dependent 26S proteasome regulatory subunit